MLTKLIYLFCDCLFCQGVMKNKIIFGMVLSVGAVLAGMFGSEGKEADSSAEVLLRPEIRIGVTLPLSGVLSDVGQASKNTLEMALNQWKKRKTKYSYKLVFKDDAFKARRSNFNANKMVNADRVQALISILRPAAAELNDIAVVNKVIHMACAPGARPAMGIYNFNNNTQFEPQADLMLEQLKKHDVKSVALLLMNDPTAMEQTQILQQKIREDGTIRIVARKVFNHGEDSYDTIVKSVLKKEKPDIFYVDGVGRDAEKIAKSIKKLTGELKLTTINDFIETSDITPFENLWFVTSAYGKGQFAADYEAMYQKPPALCAANSYDNLNLLIWAYERTPLREGENVPNNDDVVKTILDLKDWHGAIGMFTVRNDGVLVSEPEVKTVVDGRARDVDEGKVFR